MPSRFPARRNKKFLGLETLESRINLSATIGIPTAPVMVGATITQDAAPARVYRYQALNSSQVGAKQATYGAKWTNTVAPEAQKFFDQFKSKFATPSPYKKTPTPIPAPTPEPPPPPPPPAPTPTGTPVTISQNTDGNFARLVITGTTGNDSIVVSQSGSTLTIVGNGITSNVTGNFAELAIFGGAGNDTITVQSSVNIISLLYGGAGTNSLTAAGSAQNYIVTLGAGSDTLRGNGVNTAFWADSGDTVNASSAEVALGAVHRVTGFYGGVSTSLSGPNLAEPSDTGATINMSNRSLFGTSPSLNDINQGQVADCYFLAAIGSFANNIQSRLQQMAVDLGDGTYAVQFKKSGNTTFVRVDGDLPAASWGGLLYNSPKAGGAIWGSILEKAYAFFRTGAGTWASLSYGWTGSVFSDFGVAATSFSTADNTMVSTLTAAIAANKAIAIVSNYAAVSPVIGSHAYSIIATSTDAAGTVYFTLRNTWGYDGAGNDGNAADGLITLSTAQLKANFAMGSISV